MASMPMPRFEVPSGPIDNVNTVFTTSVPYRPGSTAVFRNGVLQRPDLDDGWVETDPTTGTITLKEAPRAFGVYPEVIQVFYIDTSPVLPEEVLTGITGVLDVSAADALVGVLRGVVGLLGQLGVPAGLEGSLAASSLLAGAVQADVGLVGTFQECS